jgi:hypothetical protein
VPRDDFSPGDLLTISTTFLPLLIGGKVPNDAKSTFSGVRLTAFALG